jgi:hypothetical protein
VSRPSTKALLLRRERQITAPREEEAEVIITTICLVNRKSVRRGRGMSGTRAFSDEI